MSHSHGAQRDALTSLDDLVGASYGPFSVPVEADRVAAFFAAVGDDPSRWGQHAPPMFANAALFAAAPAFLEDRVVAPFTRSLIHSEQTYRWRRQLQVGESLSITGRVESIRVRGSLNLVTFVIEAGSDGGEWLAGSSVFLMSDEPAGEVSEEPEPAVDDRPLMSGYSERIPVPQIGEALPDLPCGASRHDLRLYAEASGDLNPIHLEHDAARTAGLGGVIVHGLLMASWMAGSVTRIGSLDSIRLRFRAPLRPGVAAVVRATRVDSEGDGVGFDLALSARDQRLVTGRALVTP